MNLRRHIDGFAVFLIILSSAICINEYLTGTSWRTSRVQVAAPSPKKTMSRRQPINFNVRQVALDFIKGKSYTTLSLKREAGQSAPEKLRITTVFFSPEYPARGSWTSDTEIDQPFAYDDQIEITATSDCEWCVPFDTPKVGYFARVYVSADDDGNAPLPDKQFNRDITDAVPVVVHWPDALRRSAITSKD